MYLARIAENPGIIQEELSEMIMVDRTTVARAVKKLLADGLIVKRDNAENLKIKHLEVTDKVVNCMTLSNVKMIIQRR